MSTARLKELARQFFAGIDADHAASMPALFAPEFTAHLPGMPPLDRHAFQQFGQGFYAAFPDLRHAIEAQVAEGDTVVNSIVVHGTHQGVFQGMPPTGRTINIALYATQRFAGDKLIETHLLFDALGLMQQIGALPSPEQMPA